MLIVFILGYLAFGGLHGASTTYEDVYLVDATTGESCLHSKLPFDLKEAHIFEYMDTLLICSNFVPDISKTMLTCFLWDRLTGREVNYPQTRARRVIGCG